MMVMTMKHAVGNLTLRKLVKQDHESNNSIFNLARLYTSIFSEEEQVNYTLGQYVHQLP